MKRLLLIVSILLVLACSKEENQTNNNSGISINNAYQDFSLILSKAVSSEPALRLFLKNEAIKEFDKDYDVFYPWTKEKMVDCDHTFERILRKYDDFPS